MKAFCIDMLTQPAALYAPLALSTGTTCTVTADLDTFAKSQ